MGKISICEQHHELILELNHLGYERREIAERIGASTPTVQAYLKRRAISPVPGLGKALRRHEAAIRQMIEQDRMTQEQVAAHFGVHTSTIERLCALLDLQTCRTGPRGGADHPEWAGGRMMEKHWYVAVHVPLHPRVRNTGYVLEHRLVMEVVLGRYLLEDEVVDHRDSHTQHNWPDNLQLYATNADHLRATLSGREKDSQIRSIFGEWQSNQSNGPTPAQSETLAQCPADILLRLERHIEIHRPTREYADQAKKTLQRSGPWAPAFQ